MGLGYARDVLLATLSAPRNVLDGTGASGGAGGASTLRVGADEEAEGVGGPVLEADAGAPLSLAQMADAHQRSMEESMLEGYGNAAAAPMPVARAATNHVGRAEMAPPHVAPPTTPPPRHVHFEPSGASPHAYGSPGNAAHVRKLQGKLTCERLALVVLLMLLHDLVIGFATVLIGRQEGWWSWAGDDDDGTVVSLVPPPPPPPVGTQVVLGSGGGTGSTGGTGGSTGTGGATGDGGVVIVDSSGEQRVAVSSKGAVSISSQGAEPVAINAGGALAMSSKSVSMVQGGESRLSIADSGAVALRGDGINLDATIASTAAGRRSLLQAKSPRDGRLSLSGRGASLVASDALLGLNASSAGRVRVSAATAIHVDAGSAVALTAKTTASMASERASLTLSPTGEAYLVSSTGSVKLDSALDMTMSSRKAIEMLGTADIAMRAGGDVGIEAEGSVQVKAPRGTTSLEGKRVQLQGEDVVTLSAVSVAVQSGTFGVVTTSSASVIGGTGVSVAATVGDARLTTGSGNAQFGSLAGNAEVTAAEGKVTVASTRSAGNANGNHGAVEVNAQTMLQLVAGSDGLFASSATGINMNAAGEDGLTVLATGAGAMAQLGAPAGTTEVFAKSGIALATTAGPINVVASGNASAMLVDANSDDDSLTVGVTGTNHKASLLLSSSGGSDTAVAVAATDAAGGIALTAGKQIVAGAPSITVGASRGSLLMSALADPANGAIGGQIGLAADRPSNDAIDVHASALLGGIRMRSGLGGYTVDTTGAFNIRSAGSSSSVTVTANTNDDTLRIATLGSNVAGKLILESQGIGVDATQLLSSSTTGGIQIYAGIAYTTQTIPVVGGRTQRRHLSQTVLTGQGKLDLKSGSGGFAMETAGAMTMEAHNAPSKIELAANSAGDDLTVEVTGLHDASLVLKSSGTGTDAVQMHASGATGGLRMSSGTGGARLDTTGLIVLSTTANSALIESGLGKVQLRAGFAGAEAIGLATTNAAGGIALAAGTSGVTVDTSGPSNTTAATATISSSGLTMLYSGADGTSIDSAGTIDIGSTKVHNGETRRINVGVVGGAKQIVVGNHDRHTKVDVNGHQVELDAEHGIVLDAGKVLELVGSRGAELDARGHRVEIGAGAASAVEVGTGSAVFNVEIGNKQVTKGSFYGLDVEVAATNSIEIAANDGIDIKCPGCDVDIKSTANVAGLVGGMKTMVNQAVSVFDYRLSPFTIYYGNHLGQASTVQVINVNEGAIFVLTRWTGSGSLTWKCGDDVNGVTMASGTTSIIVCIDNGHKALRIAGT